MLGSKAAVISIRSERNFTTVNLRPRPKMPGPFISQLSFITFDIQKLLGILILYTKPYKSKLLLLTKLHNAHANIIYPIQNPQPYRSPSARSLSFLISSGSGRYLLATTNPNARTNNSTQIEYPHSNHWLFTLTAYKVVNSAGENALTPLIIDSAIEFNVPNTNGLGETSLIAS